MKTTVLTFEYEDGVLEHLTSQAPEDGSTIELISWGGHVWKRGADGRYRIASIWVPDREKFDSTIFDSEDVEAMKERATRHAVESARLSATEIATSVAEEVHGLDLATSESFQSGFWIACSKIIGALNAGHSRFSTRKFEQISVDMKLDVERIAYFAFETYNQTGETPWKTFDGRDVPRWAALNDAVRAKWIAAVKAIMIDERRRKEEAVSAAADAQRACDQAMAALRLAQEQEVGWRKRIEEIQTALKKEIPEHLWNLQTYEGPITTKLLIEIVVHRFIKFAARFGETFTPDSSDGSVTVEPQRLTELIAEAQVLNGKARPQ